MAKGKTVAHCDDGVWTPSLGDFACLEGVALITGGNADYTRQPKVEVWTADGLRKRLSDLPYGLNAHSTDYIDGGLFLCGGRSNLETCLKGDYQPSTKGTLIHWPAAF